jgi:hypothetical protein
MNDCFVDAQRVRAGTGELVGGPIVLDASIDAGYVPEIAYAAATDAMLVTWDRIEPGSGGFQSRTIAADGTPAAAPKLVTSAVGSYDANAIAYDDVSGTFLLVTHGASSQDAAIELSSDGAMLGAIVPFGVETASGNFNPRLAARTGHAEWIAVTSTEFSQLTWQRFATATRAITPTPDAGSVADDAASGADAGSTAADAASERDAAIATDAGARPTLHGGCGCRAGRRESAPAFSLAVATILVLARGPRNRARAARRKPSPSSRDSRERVG